MPSKLVWMTLVISTMTTRYVSHCVILRPDWFPYFREDGIRSGRTEGGRSLPQNVPCPSDMSEYECYHTFMAAWSRLLHKDKRTADVMRPLLRLHQGIVASMSGLSRNRRSVSHAVLTQPRSAHNRKGNWLLLSHPLLSHVHSQKWYGNSLSRRS